MKCFDHPDKESVGICIACFKARCRDCIVDHGRMVSCNGLCEHEARRLMDLRDFSLAQPSLQEKQLRWAHGTQRRASVFLLAMGMLFGGWGLAYPQFKLLLGLGGLMILFGIAGLVRGLSRTQQSQFRLCPKCGYNISHNTTGKCPECGYLV